MHRDDGGTTATEDNERALEYWRTRPALDFGPTEFEELETCVRSILSTDKDWRAAVSGDAAAAIRLALSQKPPEFITLKTDLTMTVLLRRALDNAAAALVLSLKLRSMPLDRCHRNRLATSWLVRNLYLCRDRATLRSLSARRVRGGGKS
jgi:hypothetical protein